MTLIGLDMAMQIFTVNLVTITPAPRMGQSSMHSFLDLHIPTNMQIRITHTQNYLLLCDKAQKFDGERKERMKRNIISQSMRELELSCNREEEYKL